MVHFKSFCNVIGCPSALQKLCLGDVAGIFFMGCGSEWLKF